MTAPPRGIAILGMYKSGTTALFYRIKNSLAGDVRTLFEPDRYEPEPADLHRWVLAKVILGAPEPGHDVRYETFRGFGKQLLLVRDPRDWLVSGTLFLIQQDAHLYGDDDKLRRVLDALEQKERDPASLSLTRLLEQIVSADPGRSLSRTLEWMARQFRWVIEFDAGLRDHHRIAYEDLVGGRLRALEDYLGFALPGAAEVAPEHDHVPRTKSSGDWKNWFLDEDVARFRPLFDEYLRRYGYDLDWRPSAHPVILPEHGSAYVARVVRKRRER
jgi:hypothetical protein